VSRSIGERITRCKSWASKAVAGLRILHSTLIRLMYTGPLWLDPPTLMKAQERDRPPGRDTRHRSGPH